MQIAGSLNAMTLFLFFTAIRFDNVSGLEREFLRDSHPPDILEAGMKYFNEKKLTICIGELLNRKKMKGTSFSRLKYSKFKCHEERHKITEADSTLHFAFVGDSRIRQLFLLFSMVQKDAVKHFFPLNSSLTFFYFK